MANDKPGVWGIDLGQCGLKAVRLEEQDGEVVATAFDYIEHPKILSQPEADPDELTREALQQFLSRNTLKGDKVVISVPGQSGLARFVKLPPVEEKKIADIVRFEAKQQIPFPLEEVVWDYQKLGAGIVTDGFAMETEIGLFAMKRDMVNRYLQQCKDVNIEVHLIQMAPLGLCNFVAHDLLKKGAKAETGEGDEENDDDDSGKKRCIVALDIGTDNSNLIITDGEKIIWQRPIPIGGNHFTRAITKDLKLTFAKAEHLKRNAMKSPHLKKILGAIKAVLNDFVGEVQRSLGYFTNTHRDAEIDYMVGLGNAFRLPGLQKYLQEKLGIKVHKLQKFERLSGDQVTNAPQFKENIMSFGVAYGCALQGLELTRLHTNLLPYEIQVERIVRAKKPWAAAAAAVLLFTTAILAMGRYFEDRAVRIDKNVVSQAQSTFTQSSTKREQTKQELKKHEVREENAIKMLEEASSGVNYRHQWFLLMRYINHALPRPNPFDPRGVNLSKLRTDLDKIVPYNVYVTPQAKQAFQLWVKKKAEIIDEKKVVAVDAEKDDKFIKENLLQINIQAFADMYCDDFYTYFTNALKETNNKLPGMRMRTRDKIIELIKNKKKEVAASNTTTTTTSKDEDKVIPKSGWVIEIRGYTFHKVDNFVLHSLVENLAEPERIGLVFPQKTQQKQNPNPNQNPGLNQGQQPKKFVPPDSKEAFDKLTPEQQEKFMASLPTDELRLKWRMTTKIKPYLSHVYMVVNERITEPEIKTGQFVKIQESYLPKLITLPIDLTKKDGQGGLPDGMPKSDDGNLQGNQIGNPNAPPGQAGAPKDLKKVIDRSKWQVLGEMANASLGNLTIPNKQDGYEVQPGIPKQGSGIPLPGGPPMPGTTPDKTTKTAGAKSSVPLFPRTEFVIHMIWREQVLSSTEKAPMPQQAPPPY